jgi:hypothetical protein
MLTLTRSVSEGRNALPRLRFGLVCFSNESLNFGRVEYTLLCFSNESLNFGRVEYTLPDLSARAKFPKGLDTKE